MKSQFITFILLSILLTACSPQVTVTSEVTVTLTPLPTETPIPTLTEVPLDSLPVEELVQRYLAGEIDDISFLTFPQRQSFAIALDEERDKQRGANPVIWTDEAGKQFYIDPITGDFLPVDNGTTAEQQTIDNTLPRVVDSEGYTHVFYNDAWIKIEGSQNIKSAEDIKNGDFNWPDTEVIDPQWVNNPDLLGLTIPEYNYVAGKGKYAMTPFFFLSKEVGEINIPGYRSSGTVIGYAINENDPFSVRAANITGAPSLYGDSLRADSSYTIMEGTNFIKKLETATLYYLMYEIDQKNEFSSTYPGSNGQEVTFYYVGLVPSHQTHSVINGELDNKNLVLIEATLLVEEGKKTDN